MVKMSYMEDKDFEARKPYFEAGVHEVVITGHETGKSPTTGSEFIEFDVKGLDDQEAKVRLYLTEKTVERTRSILAAIAVHNKATEAEKEGVRTAFKKIDDSDQMLAKPFLDKFIDMQAWILTEEDQNAPKPNGGFYLRSNLYSYEPKPRATMTTPATTAEQLLGGTPAELDEVPFE